MKDNFLEFMQQHRHGLDDEPLPAEIWDKLKGTAGTTGMTRARVKRKNTRTWWAVAASIAVIAGIYAMFPAKRASRTSYAEKSSNLPSTIQETAPRTIQDTPTVVLIDEKKPAEQKIKEPVRPLYPEFNTAYHAEMVSHFMGMITRQNKKLDHISKADTGHYKFLQQVSTVDSAYQQLKKKLEKMPQNQQLLEAIASLLQIQLNMINNQINQLKQLKSKKNEKINSPT